MAAAHHPDLVVAAAAVFLLLIFGFVALKFVGDFRRKDSRGYGWWW
jgi:hypothetical protein